MTIYQNSSHCICESTICCSFPSSADYHPLCSNLAEENVDKLSCLHVGASSCKPCGRVPNWGRMSWEPEKKLSYAGRASIVTWRKQRKWVEMKMQMRRMFAGHCRSRHRAAHRRYTAPAPLSLTHSTWRTRELAAAAVQTSWVLLFLGACMRSSEASGNTC